MDTSSLEEHKTRAASASVTLHLQSLEVSPMLASCSASDCRMSVCSNHLLQTAFLAWPQLVCKACEVWPCGWQQKHPSLLSEQPWPFPECGKGTKLGLHGAILSWFYSFIFIAPESRQLVYKPISAGLIRMIGERVGICLWDAKEFLQVNFFSNLADKSKQ